MFIQDERAEAAENAKKREQQQAVALEELRGLFATPLSLCEAAAGYLQSRTGVCPQTLLRFLK